MNTKQKIRYTVLGAVIMLIGIGVGAIVSPPLIAQRDGVFDVIECNELIVRDSQGHIAVALRASEEANGIIILNKQKQKAISMLSTEEVGNWIMLSDKRGEAAISLFNSEGKELTNWIRVHNPHNESYVGLWATKEIGNYILINDEQDNVTWQSPLQ